MGASANGTEYLEFTGRSTKAYMGGLKYLKLFPKKLKIFTVPKVGEIDIVSCYKKYLDLIPNEGPFYLRPGAGTNSITYTKQVVGKSRLVKDMCEHRY